MKPTQFIKDHGLEKAREVVEGASELWFAYDAHDQVYIRCGDIQDGYSIADYEDCFLLDELRSLVESVDLVNDLGGMQKLTPYFITTDKRLGYTHVNMAGNGRLCFLDDFCDFIPEQAISIKRVMEAIADYESIYGEWNE